MNEIVKPRLNDVPQAQVGTLDRLLRGKLLSAMQGIRHGRLSLHDALGRVELGYSADSPSPLQAQLRVDDMRFYRALALMAASAPAKPTRRGCGIATIP